MRLLVFQLFLLSVYLQVNAQSTIEKSFTGSTFLGTPVANQFLTSFPNMDFAVSVFVRNVDTGKIFIQYFNAFGEPQWNEVISIPGFYYLTSVNQAFNGGLLLGGYANREPGSESVVIAINKNGKVLWHNIYSPTGNTSGVYSVSENAKGEIFVYGFYSKIGGGSGGHYLLHLRKDGTVISCKSLYESGLWGSGFAARDGGLYINSHEGVQKYNTEGNLEWCKAQPEGFSRSSHGAVDADNNFYCVSEGRNTSLLVKFSSSGKIIWQKTINFFFTKFRIVNNTLIFFNTGEINLLQNTAYVFNPNGKFQRSISYKFLYSDVVLAPSNHYLLAGSMVINSVITSLARTDKMLETPCSSPERTVELHDISYSYPDIKMMPVSHPYEVKPIYLMISAEKYTTDTLCFENKPLPVNLGKDTTICLGDTLVLDAGNTGSEYAWNTGESTQKIKVTASGTYSVSVKNAFDEFGADIIFVKAESKPVISWKLAYNENIKPGDSIILQDESQNISSRKWILPGGDTSGNQKIIYKIKENGRYNFTLKITNAAGCSQETTKSIFVTYYSAYFPNAFSPNNDELNDTFSPLGYGILNYSLKIYNRWGEEVFDDENKGWDGKYKNKAAPENLYFYIAEIQSVEGKRIYINGKVYLMK